MTYRSFKVGAESALNLTQYGANNVSPHSSLLGNRMVPTLGVELRGLGWGRETVAGRRFPTGKDRGIRGQTTRQLATSFLILFSSSHGLSSFY